MVWPLFCEKNIGSRFYMGALASNNVLHIAVVVVVIECKELRWGDGILFVVDELIYHKNALHGVGCNMESICNEWNNKSFENVQFLILNGGACNTHCVLFCNFGALCLFDVFIMLGLIVCLNMCRVGHAIRRNRCIMI